MEAASKFSKHTPADPDRTKETISFEFGGAVDAETNPLATALLPETYRRRNEEGCRPGPRCRKWFL